MTFRAKPVAKRSQRPMWEQQGRRNMYMNIGFGVVVVAAVLILLIGAGASWYSDHFGSIGSVNGVSITRDDYRTRFGIEEFRLNEAENRLRDEFVAKRISQAELDSGVSAITSQKGALITLVQDRLLDSELQRQLAPSLAVAVTEADIDGRLIDEATRPAQRHAWIIEVEPEVSDDATEPTAAQVAAAKAKADQALVDLRAGKDWMEIAKAVSTASSAAQGGDAGWITEEADLDEAFRTALFAASADTPTDVVAGADGTFRIGRVTEIVAETVDPDFTSKVENAGIALADYRRVTESDVRRTKLSDALTASVVDSPTAQRRVSQIYIPLSQGFGDQVKADHILYSPNDTVDQEQLSALPDDDPAWEAARVEAQATYDKLKEFVGTPELQAQFTALAKAESDEPGADTSGGELPYLSREQIDRSFGDAIFAPGLTKGQLLEPVRSAFGWHVILFQDRRADPKSRIDTAKIRADTGEDFAALARELSEADDAETGGEIGWVAKYQLDAKLEAAIFAAAVGKTSDPIEVTDDGHYLFKIWEEQTRLPDEEQKESLTTSAFTNWYTAQKDAATIDKADVAELPTI